MKKISFAIIAAFSFFLLSCEKNIEPIEPQNNEPKLVQMTFNASVPGTRTAIGDLSEGQYSVTWSEGDQIRVIAVDDTGARIENDNEIFDIDAASVGSENASFTGTTVEGAAAYYAVYPASLDATINGTGDNATVSLSGFASHSVEAVAGGFDPSRAVMFAAANGSSFAFKHGMIYFKVTVSCANVSSIELSCKDSNTRIYGNPTYHFIDGSIDNNIGEASKDNNYIELAPSSGTFIQGNAYYIPVIAKNSTFGTLTLTYTDGNGVKIAKKTSKLSSIKPVNGTVYDLGTPPVSFEPKLTLLKTSVQNIPYSAADDLTIENAYKVSCCSDDDVTVTCDDTVITDASISNGTVTYSISANTEQEERIGYIYLKLDDNPIQTISVTQLGNGTSISIVNYTWNFNTYYSDAITLSAGTYTYKAAEDESMLLTYVTSKTNDKVAKANGIFYLQPNGSASETDRVFSFTSPYAGTLTINGCSNGSSTRKLTVKVSGSEESITASSGGDSSNATPSNHVYSIPAGTIIIYADGIFRYYEISYSNE